MLCLHTDCMPGVQKSLGHANQNQRTADVDHTTGMFQHSLSTSAEVSYVVWSTSAVRARQQGSSFLSSSVLMCIFEALQHGHHLVSCSLTYRRAFKLAYTGDPHLMCIINLCKDRNLSKQCWQNPLPALDVAAMPQVIGAKKAKQLTFDPFLTPEDQAYLRNLPFTLSMPSHGVCMVHAGFLPGVPIQQQPLEGMIEVRPLSLSAQVMRALGQTVVLLPCVLAQWDCWRAQACKVAGRTCGTCEAARRKRMGMRC